LLTFFLYRHIRNVLRNEVQKFIHAPVKLSLLKRKKAPKSGLTLTSLTVSLKQTSTLFVLDLSGTSETDEQTSFSEVETVE
jgi:hypothetical protein